MQYSDLLDILELRARRLGLTVDAIELQTYLYEALQRLVETYDFDAYMVLNPILFVTDAGEEKYAIPHDFGRLRVPRHPKECGLLLNNQGIKFPLEYVTPDVLSKLDRTTQSTPNRLTIAEGFFFLNPVPDSNSKLDYRVEGTYIGKVVRPELGDEVVLDQPSVLISETLAQVAKDLGVPQAEMLAAEGQRAEKVLVTNQAKIRQAFFKDRDRIGRRWGR